MGVVFHLEEGVGGGSWTKWKLLPNPQHPASIEARLLFNAIFLVLQH